MKENETWIYIRDGLGVFRKEKMVHGRLVSVRWRRPVSVRWGRPVMGLGRCVQR
jgi:hypothetical protein